MIKPIIGVGLLIVASFCTSGCNNTLVFAEKSGYNLAINVNDDPSTPLHVNIGLERNIAAVVPPLDISQDDQGKSTAKGEGVSVFSGFKLKEFGASAATPFAGKLLIRTQFASGQAARDISQRPDMVARIVDVSFARDAAFVEEARQKRVEKILEGIDRLNDAAALSLSANPPVQDPKVQQVVDLRDKDKQRLVKPAVARRMLKFEAAKTARDDATLATWEAAVLAESSPH
jgi:hypothetical protein